MKTSQKIAIFGAGLYGSQAFEKQISENVVCFIDNNKDKQQRLFLEKPVLSVEDFIKKSSEESIHVIIASLYANNMAKQLDALGFTDYEFFLDEYKKYYETEELVVNPYKTSAEAVRSEKEWQKSAKLNLAIKAVNDEVKAEYEKYWKIEKKPEDIIKTAPLFNHIEIETVNRCNGKCEFCPVNHNSDPREYAMMSKNLFTKIIDELADINYSGRLTTFSNNEPLLDNRIIEFNKYARERVPQAKIHMFTNGTLLSIDKFVALIEYLDELIIDNYHKDLKLLKTSKDIIAYCEEHQALKKKVTIVLRKPDEILTTRGGNAPNRKEIKEYPKDRCILPYRQLVVRPTGLVSLCCNDALGKYTLGDLNKDSLLDVWYGSHFKVVRESLYRGRENWGNCKYCDTFLI